MRRPVPAVNPTSAAERALAAAVAWNKLLLLHLNVLMIGYLLPARITTH